MIKRILTILLLTALLTCGAASAEQTDLNILVFDIADKNNPISGAEVLLSSDSSWQNKINTDENGSAKFTLQYNDTHNKYTVTVSKTGYLSQTNITTVKNNDNIYAFYLDRDTPKPIALAVITEKSNALSDDSAYAECIALPGASVSADGTSYGKTNSNGLIHLIMTRGAYHKISVKADGYDAYEESVYINPEQTSITVKLKKSSLLPVIYVYNQNKNPIGGAAVYIDEELIAYSDEYGRAESIRSYNAGTYTIKVIKEGYAEYDSEVKFSSSNHNIKAELEYSQTPLTITVTADEKAAEGAVIYINSSASGVTDSNGKYTASFKPGTALTIKAVYDGYTGDEVTYTISADGENKVQINLSQKVPTTIIGIAALLIIIALLISILIVTNKKRNAGKKEYDSGSRRDSL